MNCVTCPEGMYLQEWDNCVYSCPLGYYETEDMKCAPCVAPCATCESETHCNTCIDNWFLYGTTCIAECPESEGYYDNSNTWTCDTCLSPCETCFEPAADANECQPCADSDDCLGDTWCCPQMYLCVYDGTYCNTATNEVWISGK